MTLLKRAEKAGGKFLNPVSTAVGGFSLALKVLPQYLRNKAEVEPKVPLGPFRTDVGMYKTTPASGLRVTWFGHSGLLVEIDGFRVLIDPIWDQRASPFRFFGPKRFFEPTLQLADLPLIDVVLISHDHYDHLGAETVRELTRVPGTAGARWVTSLGVGERLRGLGVPSERIVELDWTESVDVAGLKLTSWPARHFSGRGVLDRFTTLWASFVIEGPTRRVYFGADSGWWEGFGEIAAQYDGFDLIMLEIGAFNELWAAIHLGPDNAVRAFEAMSCGDGGSGRGVTERGAMLMPIHWGLFNLALHAWRQPIERMLEVAGERGIPLWSPEPGTPSEVAGEPVVSDWWKR
jgi:L-ascorbate metabolism protein UlaG (beta-lactamase superfamily)